jgi:hypothetical protein
MVHAFAQPPGPGSSDSPHSPDSLDSRVAVGRKLVLVVEGTGFVYNMVRNITAFLVEVRGLRRTRFPIHCTYLLVFCGGSGCIF